jgi:hypothetical protein
VAERRGCSDIGPAYVPGTVWGTASNETARFERGAVPVLYEGQALTAPSTTVSRRAPSPGVDPSPHRIAAIVPVSSATASIRLIAGFTRVQAAVDSWRSLHRTNPLLVAQSCPTVRVIHVTSGRLSKRANLRLAIGQLPRLSGRGPRPTEQRIRAHQAILPNPSPFMHKTAKYYALTPYFPDRMRHQFRLNAGHFWSAGRIS